MLGFAALAEVALAEVPGGGVAAAAAGPAWRRLLAEIDPEAELNRMAPIDLVWHDPTEEEEAIVLELIRVM